jgi:hypothetical protein
MRSSEGIILISSGDFLAFVECVWVGVNRLGMVDFRMEIVQTLFDVSG